MKHPAVVVLGIAGLLLAGCGTDARTDATADYLTPGVKVAVSALTDQELHEKAFLDYVRREHPDLQFMKGDQIITIAMSFCRMYDQGGAAQDASSLIRAGDATGSYTTEELKTISGAGVASFCPQHVNKFRQEMAMQEELALR
ncbi:DUF732 domain-containing protein [Arthrobacter frigidicola]|nr:DUF732 domain-containing protein [Arthrobacter frigidicola]